MSDFVHGEWDDEWDEPPNEAATELSSRFVQEGRRLGLPEPEIDVDVLGGIAVWYYSNTCQHHTAWISCMNSGGGCILLQTATGSRCLGLDLGNMPLVKDHLTANGVVGKDEENI